MATPKLAYCAEAGRITEGVNGYSGSDHPITADTIKKYTRLAGRLRAEAIAEVLASMSRGVVAAFRAIRSRQGKRKAIRDLRALPDHLLKDIGMGRSDIPAVVEALQSPGRLDNDYRVLESPKPSGALPAQTLKKAA